MRTAIGSGLALCLIFLPAPSAYAAVQPVAPVAVATATTPAPKSPDSPNCQADRTVQQCPSDHQSGTDTKDENGLLPIIVLSILIVSGGFWIIARNLRHSPADAGKPIIKKRLTAREVMTVRSFARSLKKRSDLVAILMDEGYKPTSQGDRNNVATNQPKPDQVQEESKSDGKYDGIYDGYYPDEDEQN
jgi:hypothetical protein